MRDSIILGKITVCEPLYISPILGIRLGEHQHHPLGELMGEMLTYQRTSKRGVLTVATLRDPNNHIAEPFIELFDVSLYLAARTALKGS